MGRQQEQGAKSASDLLNFHFPTPAPSQEQRRIQPNSTRRRSHYNNRSNQPERRKRNPHLFNLHSSADHAFIITRHGYHDQQYSFEGADEPVSWENVRIVKNLVPTEQEATRCPVCLDDFICGRVTKCGHSFCLPCILRHVQMHAQNNPYTHVKCPCCAVPLHVPDLRPVLLTTSLPPILHQRMKLVKLHRTKDCPSPYLPLAEAPRRSSSHAAPSMTDIDSRYSRFNYMDPESYREHLEANRVELEAELANITKQMHRQRNQADVEAIFLHASLEIVQKEIDKATEEFNQEESLAESFASAGSGVYQSQPPQLIAANYEFATMNQLEQTEETDTPGADLRFRGDSFGSEAGQNQYGCEASIGDGSEVGGSFASEGRQRGDSIYSYTSANSQGQISEESNPALQKAEAPARSPLQKNRNKRQNQRKKEHKLPKASMYMDEESTQFYQCEDGQLCFLSRFNMGCLMSDFSPKRPDVEALPSTKSMKFWDRRKLLPLPDTVEGEIIEIETVNLTPDLRKRWPFLAHLPLYTHIRFVELDLNNLLSMETKKKFKADFEKRRKRRQSRVKAEKREDRIARKKEEERINELKARMQRVDPNDEFFQVSDEPNEVDFSGEAFGPAIPGTRSVNTVPTSATAAAKSPVLSFSNVTQSGGAFPALASNAEANFPALGSSPPSRQRQAVPASSWGSPPRLHPPNPRPTSQSQTSGWGAPLADSMHVSGDLPELSKQPIPGPKKKGKGKKIVLFSTGGQRGSS